MNYKDMEGQLDFLGLLNEYTDEQGATVRVREPGFKRSRPTPPPEPEQLSFDLQVAVEEKPEPVKEKKPVKQPEPLKEAESVKEEEPVKDEEPVKRAKSAKETKPIPKAKEETHGEEPLFKQCKKCWCYDCKHNARNEAIPREMCGMMMPCPACKSCEDEGMATVCEIGNAKEGCKTRAIEEGLYVEGDY